MEENSQINRIKIRLRSLLYRRKFLFYAALVSVVDKDGIN